MLIKQSHHLWIEIYGIDFDATKDDKIDAILRKIHEQAVLLVNQHQHEIKAAAALVYDKGTISGPEVYKILGVNPRLLGFQDDRQLAPIEQYLEYR